MSASLGHSQDVVVVLHVTLCTFRVDASTLAETHVIGRRRLSRRMIAMTCCYTPVGG